MNSILKGLGILLALIAVGIASAFAVVAFLLHQEEVAVPDLTGRDIVTVVEALRQRGLLVKIERRETHPTLAKDRVISQIPAAGSGIKKGRQVRVVVSQGPSDMQAPNLIGELYRKADITLRQAGFFPGAISRVSSESVDRDVVIAQAPPAGSPLEKGDKISLLLSSGRKNRTLVMPKLTGIRPETAAKIIERIGLQYRTAYKEAGNKGAVTESLVISQKPKPGLPVTTDTTVEITVGK